MRGRRILPTKKRKKAISYIADKQEVLIEDGEKIYQPKEPTASSLMESILKNPNLAFQILVIIITLASDQGKMERGLDGMTEMIDKLRKIADVLDSTMGSVRTAAETPQKIRQLLK